MQHLRELPTATYGPKVMVYSSNIGKGNIRDFINPALEVLYSKNEPYSWFAISLGRKKSVIPTHYSLRYSYDKNTYVCPRFWLFQGTNSNAALVRFFSQSEK